MQICCGDSPGGLAGSPRRRARLRGNRAALCRTLFALPSDMVPFPVQPRAVGRTRSSTLSKAGWFGRSAMRLSRHGRPARAASAAALIERAAIFPQHSTTPATAASLAKIAAVRGEKKIAKSIAPLRKAPTATALSAAAGRASYRTRLSTVNPCARKTPQGRRQRHCRRREAPSRFPGAAEPRRGVRGRKHHPRAHDRRNLRRGRAWPSHRRPPRAHPALAARPRQRSDAVGAGAQDRLYAVRSSASGAVVNLH